jgi:hypothetical protein
MKVKRLKLTPYNISLHVIQTNHIEKIVDKFEFDDDIIDLFNKSDSISVAQYDEVPRYFVIFHKKWTIQDIAHECLHLLNFIYDDRDISYSIDNDEPAAYYLGWLVTKVERILKKWK